MDNDERANEQPPKMEMGEKEPMKPNAEKILSLLVDLYAKQMGVKVKYIIKGE